MDNVEESKEEWQGFVIVRDGRFWVIKNTTRYIGGRFTTLDKAKQYINSLRNTQADKEYARNLREVRKEPDLKKRRKKFEETCQTPKYL